MAGPARRISRQAAFHECGFGGTEAPAPRGRQRGSLRGFPAEPPPIETIRLESRSLPNSPFLLPFHQYFRFIKFILSRLLVSAPVLVLHCGICGGRSVGSVAARRAAGPGQAVGLHAIQVLL